jgi:hypothetical protein
MPENQETQPQGNQTQSSSPNPRQLAPSASAESLSQSIKGLWLAADDKLVAPHEWREKRQDSAREILEGRERQKRAISPTLEQQIRFFEEHWRTPERIDSEFQDSLALRRSTIDRNPTAIMANRKWVDEAEPITFASPHASEESLSAESAGAPQESSKSPDRQSSSSSRAERIVQIQRKLEEQTHNRETYGNESSGLGL